VVVSAAAQLRSLLLRQHAVAPREADQSDTGHVVTDVPRVAAAVFSYADQANAQGGHTRSRSRTVNGRRVREFAPKEVPFDFFDLRLSTPWAGKRQAVPKICGNRLR